MSSTRGVVWSLLTAGWLVLVGCGAVLAPVNDIPMSSTSADSLTEPQVRAAVMRGLAAKGWRVVEEDGSVLVARVAAGGHWAVVAVAYSSRGYGITYRDSSPGLKYDGKVIHRRYNHWIRLLDERINAELVNASQAAVPQAPAPPPPPPAAAEP